MKGRNRRRLASVITGTAVAVMLVGQVVPAHADDLEDLALGQAWRGWSDARLVVPTAGLPYELNPTPTAFSRSYVDAVPGRSSGFASFYYGDEVVEEGVLEIGPGGGFRNPTLTRCNNPDAGRGTSGKVEEGGGGLGAKAVTDCSSRLKATGTANTGPLVSGQLSLSDGFTNAQSIASPGHMVGEATAHLVGVDIGDLHIGSIESWVKVDYPVGSEPLVSYKVSALNISQGKNPAVDAGNKSFTLGGSAIPASQVVDQFNAQANQMGSTAAPDKETWQVDVLAPRVYKPGDTPGRAFGDFSIINPREIAVWAPVVRVRMNNYWCCKNAGGENTGFYLGWARTRDYVDSSANSVDVIDTPSDASAGPAPGLAPSKNHVTTDAPVADLPPGRRTPAARAGRRDAVVGTGLPGGVPVGAGLALRALPASAR
ncbi:MAG TPA: hypothetical protein VHL53_08915 [Acidimicrobiia bacterium]|nr:hypothetical protein [Acidimicrobiia bacterium]